MGRFSTQGLSSEERSAQDKRAKLRAETIEKAKNYAFQEQCFLSLWRETIFDLLETKQVGERYALDNDHVISWYSGKDEGPETLINKINAYDGAHLFFKLDSSILSQLKPIVELYKVFPDLKYPADTNDRSFKIKMPLGEQIKFENNFTTETNNPNEKRNLASIEEIFRPHDILGNAMITNIKFKQTGQNVALLNTLEDVSFTINFSSSNVFFHTFEAGHPDPSSSENIKFSFVDLISHTAKYTSALGKGAEESPGTSFNATPPRRTCDNPSAIFNEFSEQKYSPTAVEKHFEIQLVVRYDPDSINWDMVRLAGDNNIIHDFSFEDRESLKSFFRNSAISMRLQLKNHVVQYSGNSGPADPSLQISFNYAAYLENSFLGNDLDLFADKEDGLEDLLLNLREIRRLLSRIQDENITFEEMFSAEMGESPFQRRYNEARALVDQNLPDRTWMIRDPQMVYFAGNTGITDSNALIPSRAKAKLASKAASGQLKGGKPDYTGEPPAQLQAGQDPDDVNGKPGPLNSPWLNDNVYSNVEGDKQPGGTDLMKRIFREAEENLIKTLSFRRRRNIQVAYGKLFEELYKDHRMYKIQTPFTTLGVDVKPGSAPTGFKGLVLEDPAKVAERRGAETAQTRVLKPGDILILGPEDQEAGVTTGATASGNPYSADEKLIDGMLAKNRTSQEIEKKLLSNPSASNRRGVGSIKISNKKPGVYFTTLGDVIDTAITLGTRTGKDGPSLGIYPKRIGIILGPIKQRQRGGNNTLTSHMSIADIPISLRMLMGFWIKKVIVKDKQSYMLGDFIKDLITDLILPALGSRCVDGPEGFEPSYILGVSSFTSEMTPEPPFYPKKHVGSINTNPDIATGGASRVEIRGSKFYQKVGNTQINSPLPWFRGKSVNDLTNISPAVPIAKQFNYMLIYINNYSADFRNPLEEEKNIKDGIYYLHVGRLPSTLLQSAFSRESIKHLREARVQSQLTRTGGLGLRDIYRFNCTMYGNGIFQPGMKVFVDPTRDGAEFAKWEALGIGGFYTVVGVTHSVIEGNSVIHQTTLDCKWDSFGCRETPKEVAGN